PDHALVPGQFAQVRVELPGENVVVVVPRTAIHYTSYGASVFIVRTQDEPPPKPEQPAPGMPPWTDLEVSQRFVEVGEARGDYVAVVSGLEEGDEVATSGLLK